MKKGEGEEKRGKMKKTTWPEERTNKGKQLYFSFPFITRKKKKKEGKKERKKKGGLSSFVSYKSNHFGEAHCCVTLEWKGGGI